MGRKAFETVLRYDTRTHVSEGFHSPAVLPRPPKRRIYSEKMKIKAQRSHHAADSTRANMPVTPKEVGTHYSCLGNRRDAYTLSPASADSWC